MQHCVSKLRQEFLCAADKTLESYDFLRQNFTEVRATPPRQCGDFAVVYSAIESNALDWLKYAKRNVRTSLPSFAASLAHIFLWIEH
jgi:hypothetical protein